MADGTPTFQRPGSIRKRQQRDEKGGAILEEEEAWSRHLLAQRTLVEWPRYSLKVSMCTLFTQSLVPAWHHTPGLDPRAAHDARGVNDSALFPGFCGE